LAWLPGNDADDGDVYSGLGSFDFESLSESYKTRLLLSIAPKALVLFAGRGAPAALAALPSPADLGRSKASVCQLALYELGFFCLYL